MRCFYLLYGIVLAAGNATRFKGEKHKSLYTMWGKEVIKYNVDLLKKYVDEVLVVIQEKDKKDFQKVLENVKFVIQKEALGTADAFDCALQEIKKEGTALICNGDTIMLEDFISKFLLKHLMSKSKATLMAISTDVNASAIIKSKNDFYIDENIKNHLLKNSGYYLFDTKEVKKIISKVPLIDKEYYITKLFDYIDNKTIYEYPFSNHYYSFNTKQEYLNALNKIQSYIQEKLVENNVILLGNCQIDYDSEIEPNVTLINAYIKGKSIIKTNSIIEHSVVENSIIENNVHIGPFSHIRDNCHLFSNVYVGNFVEMKNTIVKSKTKIKHQSLLNDCEIGEYVNIGAGTISANYNGKEKQKVIIKDQVFIGCNSTLVAPLIIEKNAFIAAGSTITENVPASTLAIARSKQIHKQRKMNI